MLFMVNVEPVLKAMKNDNSASMNDLHIVISRLRVEIQKGNVKFDVMDGRGPTLFLTVDVPKRHIPVMSPKQAKNVWRHPNNTTLESYQEV